ncbi:diguanylate cyclase [Edaphovirga cremea]|uniref:diguanylate cyclase n=1 Tax=Edaphovirga cremea TaxID=2267246 RepID=UPI000DEFA7F5|nr:diguanylate cyclase [Edaphovirga cremea]
MIPTDPLHNKKHWQDAIWLSLLILLLASFCLNFTIMPNHLVSLWLPTGVMLAALYRHPYRQWPLILLGSALAISLAHIIFGTPTAQYLPLVALNLLEATVGAGLLRRLLPTHDPLNGLANWLKFVVAAVLFTPLFSAILLVLPALPSGPTLQQDFSMWFMSESVGILAVAPLALLYQRNSLSRQLKSPSLYELVVTLILALFASYLSLIYLVSPFVFIIIPLLWSATRLSRMEAFSVFFCVTLMITLLLISGKINIMLYNAKPSFTLMYVPLLLILLPANAMAMVMHALRVEKSHIAESENRFRNAMEYSAIGMALVSPQGNWLQVNKSLCMLLGYSPEHLKKLTFQEITHPDDLSTDLEKLTDLLDGNIQNYQMEKRYLRKDGEMVWALLAVSLVRDADHQPLYFISQIEDISELKQTEQINRRLMERITVANEAGGIGIWEWDIESRTFSWDKRMRQLYDLRDDESPSYELWVERLLPEDVERAESELRAAMEQKQPLTLEFRIHTAEGGVRHIRSQANLIFDDHGNIKRLLGTHVDMTEIKQLSEALYEEKERLHITLDAINEAVICTDHQMRVTFMNPVAEKMTGWSMSLAQNQHIDEIVELTKGRNGQAIESLLEFDLHENLHSSIDQSLVLRSRKGDMYEIQQAISPLKTIDNERLGIVLVLQDVSKSRELMRKLSYNASHDMLTGLPNRASFEKSLLDALDITAQQNKNHCLAFLDLDRFKAVNDTAGHAAGDELLRQLSQLMQNTLRNSDCVARLGGDEFAILLLDCGLTQSKEIVGALVEKINDFHFHWKNKLYRIGASAGVTMIHSGNMKASELMSQADIACYAAKHSGRGHVVSYEAKQKLLLGHHHTLLTSEQVEDILQNNHLTLMAHAVSPPKTPLSVCFYHIDFVVKSLDEATISPDVFLASAALHGRLVDVDYWMICQTLNEYSEAIANKGIAISLPLSSEGVASAGLRDYLLLTLDATPIHPMSIHVMIDEAIILHPQPEQAEFIEQIRQRGCRLIMNNVGHHLSGLNELEPDSIDYLRLDKKVVPQVHVNQMDEILINIVHGTSHRLEAQTLAGPVDNQAVLYKLIEMNIDLVEGEMISSPQTLDSLLNSGYFGIR